MNHKKIEQMLSAFVDREVDEAGSKFLQEHIAGCDSCRQRIQVLHAIRERIRDAATADLPDTFVYSVQRAIRRQDQDSLLWLGTERFARNVVVALSVVVLAVVLFGSYLKPLQPIGVERYVNGEVSDSAAHAVLGSQQEISKEDVILAALSK